MGGGGGGRKYGAGRLPVITFIWGASERGRGRPRRGEGEQIFPCTKYTHVHVASTLSLFLISPFCCCSLSRYKKVPQERYSNVPFINRPGKGYVITYLFLCSLLPPLNFKNNFLHPWYLRFFLFGELFLMLLRDAFCTIDEMLTKKRTILVLDKHFVLFWLTVKHLIGF